MYEEVLLADGFNDALIGITSKNLAVYDIDKCIKVLMKDGMSEDEALDYFYFNVEGSYMGDKTPIYIHSDTEEFISTLKKKNFRKHKARA